VRTMTGVQTCALPISFISLDAYERSHWVKNNLNATQRTIFVYDSLDQFAGPLADHYENLVQALYGEHFAYLGNLDLLRMGVETRSEERRVGKEGADQK